MVEDELVEDELVEDELRIDTPVAGEAELDVIVVGAGLGGLLSAAQFLRRGARVAIVERLAHPGGRFTAKTFRGAQVSTGAVHMVPFGSNGELAGMLRSLDVPHAIFDSQVFASFHVRGQQITCRSILQLARVFGPRQFAEFTRLGAAMLLRAPRADEEQLTYRAWLEQRISRSISPELYTYFERVCHFALSVDLDDVLYPEIVETTKNMFRYGPPGIVEGGCAALTGELERRVLADGGQLRLQHDVLAIEQEHGRASGVRVRDRRTGEELRLRAPMVISNIGSHATRRLMQAPADSADSTHVVDDAMPGDAMLQLPREAQTRASGRVREASGLKVHLLSDESIIPHRGIMYCLDTERIAGVVQPSNSDRRLAPPGKHLLITHQLLRGEDINVERAAAQADLVRLFGDDFGTKVRILTMSQYRGEWPVNRAMQGGDVGSLTAIDGLYLVGDGVKPSGYLMVEGVAQSVNALLDMLERMDKEKANGHEGRASAGRASAGRASAGRASAGRASDGGDSQPPRRPQKPTKARALHWLVAPPPPYRP